jgi:hypothetical protein
MMGACQLAAEFGDGRVLIGQFLLDRQRLAELGLCLRRLPRVVQQDTKIVMTSRQVPAELGDGGVVVG